MNSSCSLAVCGKLLNSIYGWCGVLCGTTGRPSSWYESAVGKSEEEARLLIDRWGFIKGFICMGIFITGTFLSYLSSYDNSHTNPCNSQRLSRGLAVVSYEIELPLLVEFDSD